jgi:two-component system, OmpR family, response regulator
MTARIESITEIRTARVLLVDDDPRFLQRARRALGSYADLRTSRNGLTALKLASAWQPHVIVLDLLLHDLDGFTFAERLSKINPYIEPFILYTCDGLGAPTPISPKLKWRVGTQVQSGIHK